MNNVRAVWTWFGDAPHQLKGVRVLQMAIGAMLLYRLFTEGPFAAFLWGPHGIGGGGLERYGVEGQWLFRMLFGSMLGTWMVLGTIGVGALGLLAGYRTRLSTSLALAGATLLQARLPEIGDGGDNITMLCLTYMLLLLPAHGAAPPGSLRVWLHNVGVVAIALQILVLYSTSGFMKARGEVWHHGTALYFISQVEWFSHPAMRAVFMYPLVTTLATYSTMLYQVWFPVAIFSRFRMAWLLIGIWFHLSIAAFMGLVTFSTVMIGLELFLITDAEYTWLAERGREWSGSIARFTLGTRRKAGETPQAA